MKRGLIILLAALLLSGCGAPDSLDSKEIATSMGVDAQLPNNITVRFHDAPDMPFPGEEEVSLFEQACNLQYNSKPSEALSMLQEQLDKYPSGPLADDAEYYSGVCHRDQKNYTEAIAAFENVIQKYPDGNAIANAYYGIAYILKHNLGDAELALRYYTECLNHLNTSQYGLSQKAANSIKEISDISVEFGNYLLNLEVNTGKVMNGLNTETIGDYAFVNANKANTKALTNQEYIFFVENVVKTYYNFNYNWFSVVFEDGTGISFPGCNNIGTYAQLNNDTSRKNDYGTILIRNNMAEYIADKDDADSLSLSSEIGGNSLVPDMDLTMYAVPNYSDYAGKDTHQLFAGSLILVKGSVQGLEYLESSEVAYIIDPEGKEWAATWPSSGIESAAPKFKKGDYIDVYGSYRGTSAALHSLPSIRLLRYIHNNELYSPIMGGRELAIAFETGEKTDARENPPTTTPAPSKEQEYTPAPSAQNENQGEGAVYIGETGSKYHRSTCPTLKGGGHAISISEARSQGRDACKVCKP